MFPECAYALEKHENFDEKSTFQQVRRAMTQKITELKEVLICADAENKEYEDVYFWRYKILKILKESKTDIKLFI